MAFFRGWKLLRLNFFHAKGLAPSGGHILSSPAKKEYGKKDAAQGGVFPALRTHPLGWVSVAWVEQYGLPGKFASASVPCKLVSRPLAASLLLTQCGCDLKVFFRAAPCSVSTKKTSAMAACKLARCVVSASEAASGKLTRPDDGCSYKPAWPPVQCAAAFPTPYQGWVLRAGPPALSGVFLPLFFLRRRRKNGAPGGR